MNADSTTIGGLFIQSADATATIYVDEVELVKAGKGTTTSTNVVSDADGYLEQLLSYYPFGCGGNSLATKEEFVVGSCIWSEVESRLTRT